ncbi:glycoside hydrolase family 93 protein [Lentithecium fluviatile CBS 122367]|uniref:Glycoside hydrolase family 93 protein n=1 Tax=Lentithecium fluviatile CBS 122367 TaxID=1168545 RepID=A0A6G1INU4_9PLEO|nr:glycoside hydrolase family 93 protein [Lentithecium fluviatile CBS 122367]
MRLHELLVAGLLLFCPALAQGNDDPEPTSEPDPDPEPPAPTPTGIDAFANVTVYQPEDSSHQVTFPRTINLPNNTVLAAWNEPAEPNGTVHVYRSKDSGFSWYSLGTAKSRTAGRKLLQPHLLFINGTGRENDDGEIDYGTVLMAVNAVDDKSTNIEVYASWDLGETWEFASRVVSGGRLTESNGTAVLNPFLLLSGKKITVYYTDQRSTQRASKLVQQTTTDYYGSWGSAIDAVVSQFATDRPGTPTVAKVPSSGHLPNNQYILTYTHSLLDATTNTYTNPVFYKISSSPENFGTAASREIRTDTGIIPQGAPFVTWSALGGPNGTVVLTDSRTASIFINRARGEGTWAEVATTAGRAEGREVKVPDDDGTKLRLAGGSEVGQQKPSQILLTMMDLAKAIGV